MIISASYKTDIPAFYGKWFLNRLRAGYCQMINPYGQQIYTVSLAREDVEGFVFWTRNCHRFFDVLDVVRDHGFPFVVQYTINNYPRVLESAVVNIEQAVADVHFLAEQYGSRAVVWRYDPILFTSLTPLQFHPQNFEHLARLLHYATDEVVISFAQIYRKSERNLNRAAAQHQFEWHDPANKIKQTLAIELAAIAKSYHMQLTICAQRQFLTKGIKDARCIDVERLSDVAGYPIKAKHKGHRTDCGCFASRDIGTYDTCPQGCVYCYAVQNKKIAVTRYRNHNPISEIL